MSAAQVLLIYLPTQLPSSVSSAPDNTGLASSSLGRLDDMIRGAKWRSFNKLSGVALAVGGMPAIQAKGVAATIAREGAECWKAASMTRPTWNSNALN